MIKLTFYIILFLGFVMFSFLSFKERKRIVFLGDSITEAGIKPKGYISVLNEMLDVAGAWDKYELIGAGISGNKVPDLQKRLEKDVLSKKPDLVVIYIGINDVWHFYHDCCKNTVKGTSKDVFEAGLKDIIGRIEKQGAEVILCTPTVIGEKAPGDNELDDELDAYADISRQVAKASHIELLDLRKIFQEYIKDNLAKNTGSGILTYDGVHLNDVGNKFLAEQMYKVITSNE